ncbi:hypothetical protein ACA910_014806 [Epithemia clementina (nom. ined.)]
MTRTAAATTNETQPLLQSGAGARLQQQERTLLSSGMAAVVDGSYSVNFRQCLSMATEMDPDSILLLPLSSSSATTTTTTTKDETSSQLLAEAIQRGQVRGQTSVVLFDLCPTNRNHHSNPAAGNVVEDEEEEETCRESVVELNVFLSSVMNQPTDTNLQYCAACQESLDYCFLDTPWDHDKNGVRRSRRQQTMDSWEYVDCTECEARHCFEDNGENEVLVQSNDSTAAARPRTQFELNRLVLSWMEDLVACQPLPLTTTITRTTTMMMMDQPLYVGFMCNEQGTGVEVALFLDEKCSIYTSTISFTSMVIHQQDDMVKKEESSSSGVVPNHDLKDSNTTSNYNDPQTKLGQQILVPAQYSHELVTYPFLHGLPCSNIQYLNLHKTNGGESSSTGNPDYDYLAVNPYCEALLGASVTLDSCSLKPEMEDATLFDAGVENNNEYLLSITQADDLVEICSVVHSRSSSSSPNNLEDSRAQLWQVYREADDYGNGSGQFYSYDPFHEETSSSHDNTNSLLRPGKFSDHWLVVLAVFIVVVVLVLSCRQYLKLSSLTQGNFEPRGNQTFRNSRCDRQQTRQYSSKHEDSGSSILDTNHGILADSAQEPCYA